MSLFARVDSIRASKFFNGDSPFCLEVQPGHGKLCVITGPNASGKSLIRKILHNYHADAKESYIHFSMAARTSGGIMNGMMYGTERDESTGANSVSLFLKLFSRNLDRTEPFAVMLDEPEIGCSDEAAYSMGKYLADRSAPLENNEFLRAFYIISHSRYFIEPLLSLNPTHLRLDADGMTLESFVSRRVEAVDLEAIKETGHDRWSWVQRKLRG